MSQKIAYSVVKPSYRLMLLVQEFLVNPGGGNFIETLPLNWPSQWSCLTQLFFLDCYIPFSVTGRVLQPIPAAYSLRPCEQLWVWYLIQGHLSSGLKSQVLSGLES